MIFLWALIAYTVFSLLVVAPVLSRKTYEGLRARYYNDDGTPTFKTKKEFSYPYGKNSYTFYETEVPTKDRWTDDEIHDKVMKSKKGKNLVWDSIWWSLIWPGIVYYSFVLKSGTYKYNTEKMRRVEQRQQELGLIQARKILDDHKKKLESDFDNRFEDLSNTADQLER